MFLHESYEKEKDRSYKKKRDGSYKKERDGSYKMLNSMVSDGTSIVCDDTSVMSNIETVMCYYDGFVLVPELFGYIWLQWLYSAIWCHQVIIGSIEITHSHLAYSFATETFGCLGNQYYKYTRYFTNILSNSDFGIFGELLLEYPPSLQGFLAFPLQIFILGHTSRTSIYMSINPIR